MRPPAKIFLRRPLSSHSRIIAPSVRSFHPITHACSKPIRPFKASLPSIASKVSDERRQQSEPAVYERRASYSKTTAVMMPSNESTTYAAPWRVLIVGGCYAGLAAATNLLDLCEGRLPRFNPALERDSRLSYKVPVEVTLVDEKDGYCKALRDLTESMVC